MGDHKKKRAKNKPSNGSKDDKGINGGGEGKKVIVDPRFAAVHSDPRFQNVPKRETKVAIDARFSRMFTDKNFASSSTAPLDKRGKHVKGKPDAALRHYYRIDDDEIEENKSKKKKGRGSESESEELEESDREESSDESGLELESESGREEEDEIDGIKSSGTSTDEEDEEEDDVDESSTDEEDEEEVDDKDDTLEAEESVPLVQEATRRLAVVNMDWTHVRAVDLYAVLHSFLPKGGDILSVSVYPSEFGLQQMKEEEVRGPVGLFDEEDEDGDEDDGIDYEKLRAYEKSRLRYYYAVVECDSVSTADHIYKSCDGTEFERSSNVLDLRFIPDSMEFKHPARDVANEVPANYEGLDFHTKALQHSNIPISWDEDEPQRVKKFKRNFNDDQLAELDLKEFLASDSSETDDDDNGDATKDKSERKKEQVDKYRALLLSGDGSDGDGEEERQDMEITFNPGLEDLSKHILEKKNKKSESVWEEVLRKQREKKNARKRKSKDLSDDETDDNNGRAIDDSDDFFLEESDIKDKKKVAVHKSGKNGKPSQDMDEEAEAEAAASRAELELLLADDKGTDNGAKGYNLKRKRAKGKKGTEVLEEDKIPTVDYDDPRFSALFKSPLFALDPTDPQFKRSAAYARQVVQKQRKEDQSESRKNELRIQHKSSLSDSADPTAKVNESSLVKREKHELSALVRSIKAKSKQVQLPSNGNPSKKHETTPPSTNGLEASKHSTLVQSVKKKAKLLKNGK